MGPVPLPHLGWQLELHATLALWARRARYCRTGRCGLPDSGAAIETPCADLLVYTLPNVGRLELVQQRVLIWGFAIFSAGAILGFFIPHHGSDDWVKIAWSAVVWTLYAALVVVLVLGRLSHKKTALLSVAGYVFILLTFWGINSLSEAHVFPHEG